jgi:hypothetical protein
MYMLIHIETPQFTVIKATDIGVIKAATALAKVFESNKYVHEIDGRIAEVKKKDANVFPIITI